MVALRDFFRSSTHPTRSKALGATKSPQPKRATRRSAKHATEPATVAETLAPRSPMFVFFSCPRCSKRLMVLAGHVGKPVRCPECRKVLIARRKLAKRRNKSSSAA